MPKVTKEVAKFKVDDEVIMDLNGEDVPCKVVKLKGGNYITEDKDGSEYECEPHELTIAEKKKKAPAAEAEDDTPPAKPKKQAAAEVEDEPTPDKTPAKTKVKGWNDAKAATSKAGFPIGNWEALAFNGACESDGKKLSAYVDFAGVNDEAVEGLTQRIYWTLKDEKGQWTEGVTYMKGALLTLGFKEEQLEIDESEVEEELNKLLKKLRKTEPWVTVRAKEGKGGYVNLYLNGLMDDQSDKPENPLAGQAF